MKKIITAYILLGLVSVAFSLDISFDGTVGKFGLTEQRDRSTKGGSFMDFTDSHLYKLTIQDEIMPDFLINGTICRDSILQNYICANAAVKFSNINFSVGPCFSVGSTEDSGYEDSSYFDTDNLFLPGILLGVEIGNQGYLTGFFEMMTSLSQTATDMSFETYSLGVKAWVPNVICEARFDQKKSQKPVSGVTTTQTDAGLYFDIYQKTLPFRFVVKGLWRNYSKSYEAGISSGNTYTGTLTPVFNDDGTPTGAYSGTMTQQTGTLLGAPGSDSINYVVIGSTLTVLPSPSFQWYIGGECAIYTWYSEDKNQWLTGTPDSGSPTFSVTIGCKYTFVPKPARGYSIAKPELKAEMIEDDNTNADTETSIK